MIAITTLQRLSSEQKFMISAILVNCGNYAYNLILGRYLGPEFFADAAIMITLLLVLSFVAMTFQLATAKFSVLLEGKEYEAFLHWSYRTSLLTGIVLGSVLIAGAGYFQELLQTQTKNMFIIFGIGIPVYFLMSVNRGVFQGQKRFEHLATSYQSEMLSRLFITILLLATFSFSTSILVSAGILCSLVFGLFPVPIKKITLKRKFVLSQANKRRIKHFFVLTAFYELTQIIINNSDILMVKHYFDAIESGLYASLALIGRVVYFVAWMFVMLLLPKVVQKQKDGENPVPVLMKYVLYISLLSTGITATCYFLPELVINLLFGSEYLSIAPLLWKYATATSLFAIANIFSYYYLSLDKYLPVILSCALGGLQVLLVTLYHDSLLQVVNMQIIAMAILLLMQLVYFFWRKIPKKDKSVERN